ncbi:MAG: DMT family transporter [Trueperaceae bacterium]
MAARVLALFGALVISFSAIFVRLADVSPSTAAFFRPAYGLPLLMLAAWAMRTSAVRPLRLRAMALLAGCLMGTAFTFWNHAIVAIGAGLSTVLGNTQVVFVGLLAWLLHGERPTRAAMVTIPVVMLGALATSGLGGGTAYGEAPLRGVAFGLMNGVVYAAFLLLFRAMGRGRRVAAGPLADATAGAALVTLVAGLTTDPGFDLTLAWPAHGWLIATGVGPQFFGWLAILYALPRLPALETSVILLIQPVLTVVWAGLLLAEAPSVVQLAGVGTVLAGVAVLSVVGSARPGPKDAAQVPARPSGPEAS